MKTTINLFVNGIESYRQIEFKHCLDFFAIAFADIPKEVVTQWSHRSKRSITIKTNKFDSKYQLKENNEILKEFKMNLE